MKIKNIGGKIIRIGTLTLLPGEAAPLPKDFENNPVVEHFVDMGLVEFEKSTKQVKPDKMDNENGQKSGDDKEPADDAEDNGDEEPADDGQSPATDNNGESGEEPAPKPGTTKTGRGGRNK